MSYFIAGAGLALSAYGMYSSAQTANAQGQAAVATSKGQLEVMKAQTEQSNAESGLQNHITALNNERKLKKMGKNFAAAQESINRINDSRTSNKLEQGLRQAEALGATQAGLAMQGTGGAAKDAIEGSLRLRDARANEDVARQGNRLHYDNAKALAGLVGDSMADLDMTVHSGSVSAAQLQTKVTGGTNWASAIGQSDMIDQVAKIAGAYGATRPTPTYANLSVPNSGLGLKAPSNWGASTAYAGLYM